MEMKIIFCIIAVIIGLYIIDENANNKFKHNILMGIIGYIITVIIPTIIVITFFI